MVFGPSDPALRARMMKTACVISSARCGSRACRMRHGINQIDVARDERGKRLLGIAPGVFPQQRHVVIQHFTSTFTRR